MMKKVEVEFPNCWEELTPSEWQYLLKLRGKLEKDNRVSLVDVKREWTRFVLRGRKYPESLNQ